MPRAGCTIDDEGQFGHEANTTNLRLFNFWFMRLLGRRGTNGETILGFPISWLHSREALPAPPTHPDAVARMPSSHASTALARLDSATSELLVDADLNDVEGQRREYQRLQEDADKKPAAKPTVMKRDKRELTSKDNTGNTKNNTTPDTKKARRTAPSEPRLPTNPAYLPPPVDQRLTPLLPTDKWLIHHNATISPTGVVEATIPVPDEVQEEVRQRMNYTRHIAPLCEFFTQPPQVATAEEIRRTVEEWLEWNPVRFIEGRLLSLYPHIAVPQYIQNWMNTAQVANLTETSTEPTPANVVANPPPAVAMNQFPEHDAQGHTADSPIVIASDSDSDLAQEDNNNPKST